MKKITFIHIVFVITFLMSGNSFADIITFKRVNGWQAWGGLSENGRKVCGISTQGGGRWFGIKYFYGDRHVIIHLSKDTWTAKRGTKVDILMKFDNESPWRATATSFFMSDGDVALEFQIRTNQLERWFLEFKRSYTLYIRFPKNNIDDWRADLSGTRKIANAMNQCLQVMNSN